MSGELSVNHTAKFGIYTKQVKTYVLAFTTRIQKKTSAPTPQKSQTHSNNLSAVADELFECVWPFLGVGT